MPTLTQDELIGAIETMTVLDLSKLVKALEERFGVSAAAPMMMGNFGGPAAAAPVVEEQTEFDAILTSAGDKKIQVLKVLRELTGLGLKEAKDLVDNPPKAVKEKVKKEEAEAIKAKLEAEGAKVDVK